MILSNQNLKFINNCDNILLFLHIFNLYIKIFLILAGIFYFCQILFCRVMKSAAMPSCLGGGEKKDKFWLFT